jgi:hypothetical protein
MANVIMLPAFKMLKKMFSEVQASRKVSTMPMVVMMAGRGDVKLTLGSELE